MGHVQVRMPLITTSDSIYFRAVRQSRFQTGDDQNKEPVN